MFIKQNVYVGHYVFVGTYTLDYEILHKIDKGLQLSNALAQLKFNRGWMLFQYAMIHNKQLQLHLWGIFSAFPVG